MKAHPIIAILVGQAINMALRAVTAGTLNLPDATPLVASLVDALGHATGETDEQRAQRRASTEAIFASHSESLIPPEVKP